MVIYATVCTRILYAHTPAALGRRAVTQPHLYQGIDFELSGYRSPIMRGRLESAANDGYLQFVKILPRGSALEEDMRKMYMCIQRTSTCSIGLLYLDRRLKATPGEGYRHLWNIRRHLDTAYLEPMEWFSLVWIGGLGGLRNMIFKVQQNKSSRRIILQTLMSDFEHLQRSRLSYIFLTPHAGIPHDTQPLGAGALDSRLLTPMPH
ncbi:hypothetical protein BJY01DRAFT_10903 [Aspergillus pseudoustus]|uniref:Uncharacterized protein n=1 Tax=Aspergillus pseudoustus TaxID=1810923 RepID=A0ABR4KST3_9EURO